MTGAADDKEKRKMGLACSNWACLGQRVKLESSPSEGREGGEWNMHPVFWTLRGCPNNLHLSSLTWDADRDPAYCECLLAIDNKSGQV